MSYNKDENSQFVQQTGQDPQTPAQGTTPDSPAAYGIHRFEPDSGMKQRSFTGGVAPAPSMWEAYKLFWQNYVDFSTRSRRSEFWWPTLINSVIGILLYAIMVGSIDVPLDELGKMEPEEVAQVLMQSGRYWVGSIPLYLFGLVTFLPCISLGVRRLHDLNYSGWWYALMLLNSCCCGIVVIVFLFIFAQDSKPGTNEWGPSPKYPVTE